MTTYEREQSLSKNTKCWPQALLKPGMLNTEPGGEGGGGRRGGEGRWERNSYEKRSEMLFVVWLKGSSLIHGV